MLQRTSTKYAIKIFPGTNNETHNALQEMKAKTSQNMGLGNRSEIN